MRARWFLHLLCLVSLLLVVCSCSTKRAPHSVGDHPTRLVVQVISSEEDLTGLEKDYKGLVEKINKLESQKEREKFKSDEILFQPIKGDKTEFDLQGSLVVTAHDSFSHPGKYTPDHFARVVALLNKMGKKSLERTFEKALYSPTFRPSVLRLSTMLEDHQNLKEALSEFLLQFGSEEMAQDFLNSGIKEYVAAGKIWMERPDHPQPKELPRVIVVQLEDSVIDHTAEKIHHGENVDDPHFLDSLIYYGATLLDEQAKWTDRHRGRKIYDLLKDIDGEIVGDGLAKQVIFRSYRSQLLFLGVKLGIPGSEEKMNAILLDHGDKTMAEDFLNSGSRILREGGEKWAQRSGYNISFGSGSHRTSWGNF